MPSVRYHDLTFQADMLTAQRDDGSEIRLTRQERALLLRLTRQPNLLVTRTQLLDGLGDESGSLGERNIDYLINRLRKRLGDNARKPRFIATQYGEGYVWLAEPERQEQLAAFLLIGPAYGLSAGETVTPMLLEQLAAGLRRRISDGRPIVCRPGWRPARHSDDDIAFNLEIATHLDEKHLHLALVLREGPSQAALQNFRLTLERDSAHREIEGLAERLIAALWTHAALPDAEALVPASDPPHVRMHDASAMLIGRAVSWRETDTRLRTALFDAPNDPRLKVLLALNLYARLVQSIGEIMTAPIDPSAWDEIEDEIERLVLSVVPEIEDDPLLLLGAAKLLFFINRGYAGIVENLTEKAFHKGTAFSAVFAMKAQMAAARGETDKALELYGKAIETGERGSHFHVYLLTLKAIALLATNRRTALDHVVTELRELSPASTMALAPYFVSPRMSALPEHLEQRFAMVPPEIGRHMLTHLYRTAARHFGNATHRRNVLDGFATHLARHHGAAAIPPELSGVLRLGR